MSDDIAFDRTQTTPAGEVAELSPLVRRIIAGNSGPMTFTGTCSYIIGRGTVAIIDPGPDDAGHVARLLAAVDGETVSHIVVTHTHRDHSPAVPALQAATGARVVGCGPHRPSRALGPGEERVLDAAADSAFAPDWQMRDADAVSGPGWSLRAVETPGHTANHLAYTLAEEETLFSGDHVMAWSTSIVAPPDGSMAAYMASIEKLRGMTHRLYRPGHGGPVTEPQRFLRGLVQHRRQREAAVLNRIGAGDETIAAMVPAIYQGLAPALHGAAALSVLAQIEDLVARGLVAASDAVPGLSSRYRLA
ncbi:MAG: MBL fold metallo-hydrolase [Bosea sp.]|uniref:MBL fold metallo-hydrolase n=1 Tax=unclassified Bosea (in: a-proteobacteria) TaxID=2653178 RepID=UPI0009690371|nr:MULTISPECIES: MBL fold metallo-hydrolase [unclassified Bosea (in: a-proteobacteria)]MBN9455770.1 MBL fold metallo-hydrolase [Bosea sp. (in: a-proteobacteria)]OJV06044.1 MAG: MBL fold metallo-hydrolase [Bosea sp. 67-29]